MFGFRKAPWANQLPGVQPGGGVIAGGVTGTVIPGSVGGVMIDGGAPGGPIPILICGGRVGVMIDGGSAGGVTGTVIPGSVGKICGGGSVGGVTIAGGSVGGITGGKITSGGKSSFFKERSSFSEISTGKKRYKSLIEKACMAHSGWDSKHSGVSPFWQGSSWIGLISCPLRLKVTPQSLAAVIFAWVRFLFQ